MQIILQVQMQVWNEVRHGTFVYMHNDKQRKNCCNISKYVFYVAILS